MPGTTSLGIRYPLMTEVVSASAWQDFADDVDTALTNLETLRTGALQRMSVSLSSATQTTTPASATDAQNRYDTIDWKSDTSITVNLVSPGVYSYVQLPAGVWFIRASATASGWTTMTMFRSGIWNNAGTTQYQLGSSATITGGTTTKTTAAGVVMLPVATNMIGLVRWVGTGVATIENALFQAYRILELGDLV
jgi:hypothetical protein